MADIAHAHDTPLETGSARRPLAVVPHLPASADDSGDVGTWRNAAIGATVGFVVTAVLITVAGTIAGIGAGGALGLGVFVGAFGGVGFGFMMGGMATFARQLDARH